MAIIRQHTDAWRDHDRPAGGVMKLSLETYRRLFETLMVTVTKSNMRKLLVGASVKVLMIMKMSTGSRLWGLVIYLLCSISLMDLRYLTSHLLD